jgi:hypothetical protein
LHDYIILFKEPITIKNIVTILPQAKKVELSRRKNRLLFPRRLMFSKMGRD